jgi:predicted RNA-binding protein with PUA-like domain
MTKKTNRTAAKKRAPFPAARAQGHWIVKPEPTAYSWETFVRDGGTAWTGVRNPQARANLRAMRIGDPVFFYHSVIGKEVVGLAKVTREAYPDKDAREWAVVDLAPVRPLGKPVTLAQIKEDPALQEMALVRQARLSVIPLTRKQFARIIALGEPRL